MKITGIRLQLCRELISYEEVVLNLELFFRVDLPMAEVAQAIDRIERAIRERHPEMTYVFLGAEALRGQARDQPRDPAVPSRTT